MVASPQKQRKQKSFEKNELHQLVLSSPYDEREIVILETQNIPFLQRKSASGRQVLAEG